MLKTVTWIVLLLLVFATRLNAQGCSGGSGDFHCWATWRSNDPFRNHPTAHSLGGAGMLLVARGPWFAESFRDKRWKRLAIVGFGGAVWQFQNLKEIQGYEWDFAALDWSTNLLSATLFDLLLEKVF